MSKYKTLYIIGTSHIAKESINQVKKVITNIKPDIIALELDKARYNSIINKQKTNQIVSIKFLGIKGFIFNFLVSILEKSLGKQTGIKPGSEMKTAINLAKKHKIKIYLIDQPIHITIKKLTTQITRKEKLDIIKELLISLLFKKQEIKFDLNKVPPKKVIKELMAETKQKYPTFYNILVEERNVYMAEALDKIMKNNPKTKIVAIVGAGHEKQIMGDLKSTKS